MREYGNKSIEKKGWFYLYDEVVLMYVHFMGLLLGFGSNFENEVIHFIVFLFVIIVQRLKLFPSE